MANIEELKKIAEEKGVEISEEMLESVAGGRYDRAVWTAMSPEERIQAYIDSDQKRADGEPCMLD